MRDLTLEATAELLQRFAGDYETYVRRGMDNCPLEHTYRIVASDEGVNVRLSARTAALSVLTRPLTKLAFDTRRIDQEHDRNPRKNLQYWHRAQQFIDASDETVLRRFARLMGVLAGIRDKFGSEPEWFESYSRVLYDTVQRILRIKQGDLDVFKPQLSYLRQLVFARYRLSMEDLAELPLSELEARILAKDEALLKRGQYMKETGLVASGEKKTEVVVDGNAITTQESIVNAIFGNNGIRRDGEKTVERTITITIKDQVLDD